MNEVPRHPDHGDANKAVQLGGYAQSNDVFENDISQNPQGYGDNCSYDLLNGWRQIASGVGNWPTAAEYPVVATVINPVDHSLWLRSCLGRRMQLDVGDTVNLAGTAGEFVGHRMIDEGTNTSVGAMLCMWTCSVWQPSDGGAKFT